MQPLFGSETDGIQERKLVKRLLRKKKITFILTALCALIYLLQNIGFEEPIIRLILGKIRKYGVISLMLLFICRYRIFYLTFRGFGYSVARLNADWVLSIFYYSF